MILSTGIVNSLVRIFGDIYLRNEIFKLFCCKKLPDEFYE